MSTSAAPRSLRLRFCHAVLALAVIHQLIGSEWMGKPWRFDKATAIQITLFELHEWVGLTAVVMLLVLAFSLVKRHGRGSFGRYLPWLQAQGRAALGGEASATFSGLRRLSPPSSAQTEAMAGAVQGLGLLILFFFAVTGTAMWLLEDNLDLMHQIGSIHEYGALPLKVYLFGHAGMAVIHEWRGEGLFRRMSPLRLRS